MALSLSPEQRSMRARLAAHAMHAKHDSKQVSQPARDARWEKYRDQVKATTPGLSDEEITRRAEHLRKAEMYRLALASSRARARKVATP
jgi:hypothetical protein